MMKAYPEYKNSNVETIGKIPATSHLIKLAYIFSDSNAGEVIEKAFWDRGNEILYTCKKTPMKSDYDNFPDRKKTTPNDLLLTRNGTPYVHKPLLNSIYSNVVQRITLTKDFNRDYVKYALSDRARFLRGYGVSIESLNFEMWKEIQIIKFSLEEQFKIVNYLDTETFRIDNLISEKEKFIKLLNEKRNALIAETVTKGLDKSLKMKPSGIDWIGEIPEHWELTKLRYVGQCQNGINIGGDAFGSGYPFISYGDVYNNRALPDKIKGLVQSTPQDREIYSIQAGDVLFTRTSETIDEIGFTSVCYKDMPDAVFAGFLIKFRPKKNAINPLFSEYYFQNEKLRAFFVKEMNLVTRASLSQELLKRMPVPLPPENEQREIAEYLSKKDNSISELIQETKSSIELLKEHRTALISATVTGKIDVREVA